MREPTTSNRTIAAEQYNLWMAAQIHLWNKLNQRMFEAENHYQSFTSKGEHIIKSSLVQKILTRTKVETQQMCLPDTSTTQEKEDGRHIRNHKS